MVLGTAGGWAADSVRRVLYHRRRRHRRRGGM